MVPPRWLRALPAVLGVALLATGAGAVEAGRLAASSTAQLRTDAKGLMARSVMLISLPVERKVSYVEISDLKAVGGVVRPLVDSGLSNPCGIAYHEKDSTLFVADSELKKIFRYTVKLEPCPAAGCPCDSAGTACGLKYHVSTGKRLTIMENVLTQWVTVDQQGNLYYSDQQAQSVNKLSAGAIMRVANGILNPKDLQPTSESQAEALQAAAEASGTVSAASLAAMAMYTAGSNKNVVSPAGVVADATEVYWANQAGGSGGGTTIGAGPSVPQEPVLAQGGSSGPSAFQTYKLAGGVDAAYGIAQTDGLIVFTDDSNYVYCVAKSGSAGGRPTALVEGTLAPRGIVWDGSGTVFVADSGTDTIYSMPSGHCAAGVPMQQAAYVHGPFGLALIKASALSAHLPAPKPAGGSWLSWLR